MRVGVFVLIVLVAMAFYRWLRMLLIMLVLCNLVPVFRLIKTHPCRGCFRLCVLCLEKGFRLLCLKHLAC